MLHIVKSKFMKNFSISFGIKHYKCSRLLTYMIDTTIDYRILELPVAAVEVVKVPSLRLLIACSFTYYVHYQNRWLHLSFYSNLVINNQVDRHSCKINYLKNRTCCLVKEWLTCQLVFNFRAKWTRPFKKKTDIGYLAQRDIGRF